ncbi:MAG TPA: FUSC family protein [Sphingomicrobium sp.]|nr:FUSC family protein [Sphingomicrobium sp.]
MQIRDLVVSVTERCSATGRDVLASTIAGAVAWFVAQTLYGHPHPVFAAIIAIVCLGPGLPSHTRQALGLLTGVGIGIVVGELALAFPNNIPLLRGSLSVFVAMMLASSFGLGPVVPIQAGVSTLLIFVLGPETAGYTRLIDSAVGIVVALLFSQVILTPDPVSAVQRAARKMLLQLGSGLSQCATALAKCDRKLARNAMEGLSTSHDSVVALGSSIRWAEQATRWSLRGRLSKRKIGDVVTRYDRRSDKLYALVLLFGEALSNALSTEDPPPRNLRARVHRLAELRQGIASGTLNKQTTMPALGIAESVSPAWRTCVSYLQATEEALDEFAVTADLSS